MPRLALILPIALAACTQFPELDSRIGPEEANAPFPTLLPLAPLVAQANANGASGTSAQQAVQTIAGRIAALQARADRLRGPVIPLALKARMLRGVDQGALQ